MISVIIPVYNAELYIDRMMESVVHQTYQDFEVILVEDASTDASALLCEEWVKKDNRVRLIKNEVNQGQGIARNKGIEASKGEYLYFCDADDFLDERILESLLDVLEKNDAEISFCDYWQYNWRPLCKKYAKEECCCPSVAEAEVIELTVRDDMPDFFPCILWNKLYKKQIFEDAKICFPDKKVYFEDFYVNCMIMYYGYRFVCTHKTLYHYFASREEGGNSNDDIEKMANDLKYIFSMLNEHFKNLENPIRYERAFKNHAQKSLRYHLTKKDAVNSARKEEKILEETNVFLNQTYQENKVPRKLSLFGSFSLHRAIQQTPYKVKEINYMTVASAVKDRPALESEYLVGDNLFRTIVLENDLCKNIQQLYENETGEYLIIDLLDEHYQTVMLNESIVTYSEFFENYAKRQCIDYKIIDLDLDEWKECCKRFAEVLCDKFGSKIIIVENELSLGYGNYKLERYYDVKEEIEIINEVIRKKTAILEEYCSGCQVVKVPDELNFTHCKHAFGVVPQYHNYARYRYIANEVIKIIERTE